MKNTVKESSLQTSTFPARMNSQKNKLPSKSHRTFPTADIFADDLPNWSAVAVD